MQSSAAGGTQTSALSFGGNTGSYTAASEAYNGTTWSVDGSMNTARTQLSGSSPRTASLAFGGEITPGAVSALTEDYTEAGAKVIEDIDVT